MKAATIRRYYWKAPVYFKETCRKFLGQRNTRPVFVLGYQRSGTTMLIRQLNRHFWTEVKGEISDAMEAFRIKKPKHVNKLVEKSKAKVLILKPLEDTHRALEFLDDFPDSRLIFIFRHYADVVNSSMSLGWGEYCENNIERISLGVHFPYGEAFNLSEKNVQFIRNLYDSDMSQQSCTALLWYLRNTIFFDFHLSSYPHVLLVGYERLVNSPREEMLRVLDFLELGRSNAVLRGIHNQSVKKRPIPNIDSEVKKICDSMYEHLLECSHGVCI